MTLLNFFFLGGKCYNKNCVVRVALEFHFNESIKYMNNKIACNHYWPYYTIQCFVCGKKNIYS